MKRFIRCVCFFLVVVMLFINTAFAEENPTPWSSSYFAYNSTFLWKISETQFQIWFDVTAVKGMDELGTKTIKVQRSSDGETWTTMKTYTKESYPQMICEDTAGHSDCVTYTGTKGYYYRAYVVFYAKNSSGTGILNRYTDTIKL